MTTTNLEFNSTLFRTPAEMCRAIADEWLNAGGNNTEADIRGFLADSTDAELAQECINGWYLDQRIIENDMVTWLETRGATASDIEAGFAYCRARHMNK